MVDGGFYLKQAKYLFGEKTAKDRADELIEYCYRHLNDNHNGHESKRRELYRIFYYDCPPSEKTVYHPLTQQSVNLSKKRLV